MSTRHGFLGTGSSSSSGSNSSGGRRRRAFTTTMVTVFEAETGRRLDVELFEGVHDGGGATEALRRKLYSLTGVPPENQILLCGGPPYKPLRSQLPPPSITVTVTNNVPAAAGASGADAPSVSRSSSSSNSVGVASSTITTTTTTTITTKIFLFDWRTLAPEQQQSTRPSSNSQIINSSVGQAGSLTPSGGGGGGAGGGGTGPLLASSAVPGVDAGGAGAAAAAELLGSEEAAEFVGPAEVTLPTEPGASPSPLPPVEGSYLLKTIAGYERGSMLTLNRGQAYLESSRRRLEGGEKCTERMQTMVDALDAAVSNSLDHWEPLQRAYSGLKEKLGEQALRHESMLETFEQDVATLGTIPLHPALAAASAATAGGGRHSRVPSTSSSSSVPSHSRLGLGLSSNRINDFGSEQVAGPPLGGAASTASRAATGGRSGGGLAEGTRGKLSSGQQPQEREGEEEGAEEARSGQTMTLLDCIPVEREQRLLDSCRTSQRRFQQEAENVAKKYATIEKGIQEQRGDPVTANDAVQDLLERARRLCRDQERKRAALEANYVESFNLAKENRIDDAKKQNAIKRLTELILESEKLVPIMKDNDLQTMAVVLEIARAKASLSSNLRRRLREVSRLQTDIGKIQKHQELVGMAWGQKEEQFEHLGKVARMPAAYKAFLAEVLRQRRFHQDFETKVSDFCSSMSALRSAEILSRQSFLHTHLGNLPPVFLEMAPGLRNTPPMFNPGPITPLRPGDLPEVYPEPDTKDDNEEERADSTSAALGAEAVDALHSVTSEAETSALVAAPTAEAAVVTQTVVTQTEDATEAAAVSKQTVGAMVAEGAAVSTQTDAAQGAAVGTQTTREQLLSRNEPSGDGGDGDQGEAGGGADVRAAESVFTDARTLAHDEGEKVLNSGEERTAAHEEGVRSYAALVTENARLAKELAEARSRLGQLGADPATVSPAAAASAAMVMVVESDENPGTTATAAAVLRPEGEDPTPVPRRLDCDGDRGRSYSDVVVSGSGGMAASAAAAGGDGRGSGRPAAGPGVDSGSSTNCRRGSSSSSSSKEATKNQLAAYRAGLSMLVKLTDQQRSAATAAAAAADAVAAGKPAVSDAETMTRTRATATAAVEEVVGSSPSPSSPTPVGFDDQHPSGSSPPTPSSLSKKSAGAGVVKAEDGSDGDNADGAGAGPLIAEGGAAGELETGPFVPEGAQGASLAAAVAPEVEKEHAAGPAAVVAGAPALALAVSEEGSRQGESGAAAESSAPRSTSSPGRLDTASPERLALEGTKAIGARAAGAVVARQSATLGGVDRIRRAADYVATHLQYNHARVEELMAFEALASVPRISMCSFGVQDIALFLPTMVDSPEGSSGRPVFLAFHVNCPNRFLSPESINNARASLGASPAYILGRIIQVEQHVASEEPNPYNVAPKTVYYVLTAENVG